MNKRKMTINLLEGKPSEQDMLENVSDLFQPTTGLHGHYKKRIEKLSNSLLKNQKASSCATC
jgi:hypothetical protein